MTREPSAVVQVMLWCGRLDGVRQRDCRNDNKATA